MTDAPFIRDPSKPFVASNSSLGTLNACERMFAHAYVWKTKPDADYVTPLYFRFGRAFHKVLELTDGDATRMTQEMLEGVAMAEQVDWETSVPKLIAMVRAYDAHRPKDEHIIAREIEISGEDWILRCDAIAEGAQGLWWIIDYKSVGVALDPLIRAKLRHDSQVCLYVKHAPQIAASLGLDPARFGGFSYREIEKPRERQKKTETVQKFIGRMTPNCRTTNLTPADLAVEETVGQMATLLERARGLFSTPETTAQNRTKCVDRGTVCKFWSACNGGKTYTETKAEMAEDCDKF